jgi:hypothetical protein
MQDAEIVYQRALGGFEVRLRPEHKSIINNLGLLYRDQGKAEEAETLYRCATIGFEKTLGSGHSTILRAVSALIALYRDQSWISKADILSNKYLVVDI